MIEIWKDIQGFEGVYQVSNYGRVKSLQRMVWNGTMNVVKKEMLLKPNRGNHGYLRVGLYKNNTQQKIMIHHLVASVFLNYEKKGIKYVIDHIDNNRLNNNLSNLQIITFRENISKDLKNKTSIYTGVSWNSKRSKWLSQIMIEGKRCFLGYYDNEIDANNAYKFKLKANR